MKGKTGGKEICTFSDKEADALCRTIRDEGLYKIYTGHCTGLPALKSCKSASAIPSCI